MTPPCKKNGKECPLRRAVCQARCEKYMQYRETLDKENKAMAPGRAADDYLNHSRRGRLNKKGHN